MKRTLSIRSKITLLSFGSVMLAIFLGGALLIENISQNMEEEISMRARAIARTVAQMDPIQQNVGKPGGEKIIQPLAEKIRLATDVEYIVVFDMERVRYSHPLEERIGQPVEAEDVAAALANHEYLSKAQGINGPSVRALVPIKIDEGRRQVGVVMVGILTPTISNLVSDIRDQMYSSLAIGLLVGLLGAAYLANNIKRAMLGLEPEEIARRLEERIAVFQAMEEGIIAVDQHNRITIANKRALELLHLDPGVVGQDIHEVAPETGLPRVVETGEAEVNVQMLAAGRTILASCLPIRVKGQIVGAVTTFRDKTEAHRLAEELTGVRTFIDALRAQNHENLNKLHTIAGLIKLEKHQEAIDYIFGVTEEQEELTRFLSSNIKEYAVAGLLLGKFTRAKERRIDLSIDPHSRLTRIPKGLDPSSLVVILGNLLENAMDAVASLEESRRRVSVSMVEEPDGLWIEVEDCGDGIPEEVLPRIFERGFSTKGSDNRGFGLYFVQRIVAAVGGAVEAASCPGSTRFTIHFPEEVIG